MNTTEKLILTEDQKVALTAFQQFLLDPVETVFVLQGFSGCGKTTLVTHLIDELPKFTKTMKLVMPSFRDYQVALTATTNKAAENLKKISGEPAQTIHSFLGLRVQTDYKTGTTSLIVQNRDRIEGYLLFIDESSYIDRDLLEHIFAKTNKCKIVFIGDPAQLTPVKSTGTPVFAANFSGAMLKEVVRQAHGNPIVDLSTKFRNTVNTGEFFKFKPDGNHVQHLNNADFMKAIEKEFTRPDWRYADSKILGWTNKCVIDFNNHIKTLGTGNPAFMAGDYAVCNSYIQMGRRSIKTDQLVEIDEILEPMELHGAKGRYFILDGVLKLFMPDSLTERNSAIKKARANNNLKVVAEIEEEWVDLRAAYACTINKAQGSTFDSVYIDLNDVSRCNSGDQIARMLYVAVSRARNNVYLTGDLA
jgi:hypothetical protein